MRSRFDRRLTRTFVIGFGALRFSNLLRSSECLCTQILPGAPRQSTVCDRIRCENLAEGRFPAHINLSGVPKPKPKARNLKPRDSLSPDPDPTHPKKIPGLDLLRVGAVGLTGFPPIVSPPKSRPNKVRTRPFFGGLGRHSGEGFCGSIHTLAQGRHCCGRFKV